MPRWCGIGGERGEKGNDEVDEEEDGDERRCHSFRRRRRKRLCCKSRGGQKRRKRSLGDGPLSVNEEEGRRLRMGIDGERRLRSFQDEDDAEDEKEETPRKKRSLSPTCERRG